MSFKLIKTVLESEAIDKMDKLVLAVFCTYADKDGTSIRPSMNGFAKRCGISRTTAYTYLDKFEAASIISKTGEKYFYGRGHWSHVWLVNVDALSTYCTVSSRRTVSKRRTHSVHGADSTVSSPRMQPYPVVNQPLASQPDPRVSEGVSEDSDQSQTGNQNQDELKFEAENLAYTITEMMVMRGKLVSETQALALEVVTYLHKAYDVPVTHTCKSAMAIWNWNQSHKTGGLKFRGLRKMLESLKLGGEDNVWAQANACYVAPEECRICRPKKEKKHV